MTKVLKLLLIASVGVALPASAHPEGDYPTERRGPSTAQLAEMQIEKMIAAKKLAPSWSNAKMVKFDYREKNGGQYVLVYENAAIKQAARRKLFVVMTTNGMFVSAGYKLI